MEVLGITLCAQELMDQAKGRRSVPASYWQNGGGGWAEGLLQGT